MSRPENENPQDRVEKTARELRKHRPRPSETLVSRIERLAERSSSKRTRPAGPWLGRRKLVLALAAALAVSVAGAIVNGQLRQSSKPVAVGESHKALQGVSGNSKAHSRSVLTGKEYFAHVKSVPSAGGNTELYDLAAPRAAKAASGSGSDDALSTTTSHTLSPLTSGKRLAELRATLVLKVDNQTELSSATAKAMKIASSLGGYIASARYQAPSRGVAISRLTLKIPAARSQDALTRISALGAILSQQVSLKDLERTVTIQTGHVKTLEQRIADLERSLSDTSLTTAARSQLQVQLANARADLRSLQAQRAENVRKGRLATITLTLTTGDLPKPAASPSRIHKAVDRAWDGLSSEISWAAVGLIVASPFLLLATIAGLLLRSRRRREERRLLEK